MAEEEARCRRVSEVRRHPPEAMEDSLPALRVVAAEIETPGQSPQGRYHVSIFIRRLLWQGPHAPGHAPEDCHAKSEGSPGYQT